MPNLEWIPGDTKGVSTRRWSRIHLHRASVRAWPTVVDHRPQLDQLQLTPRVNGTGIRADIDDTAPLRKPGVAQQGKRQAQWRCAPAHVLHAVASGGLREPQTTPWRCGDGSRLRHAIRDCVLAQSAVTASGRLQSHRVTGGRQRKAPTGRGFQCVAGALRAPFKPRCGTEGRTRTDTISLSADFESAASTNSATPARGGIIATRKAPRVSRC